MRSTMRKPPALSNWTTHIIARCSAGCRAVRTDTSSAAHITAAIRRCRATTTVGSFAARCCARAFAAAADASDCRFYAACRAARAHAKTPAYKARRWHGAPTAWRCGRLGAVCGVFGLAQSGVACLALRIWRCVFGLAHLALRVWRCGEYPLGVFKCINTRKSDFFRGNFVYGGRKIRKKVCLDMQP